jgi:hypothetical protein
LLKKRKRIIEDKFAINISSLFYSLTPDKIQKFSSKYRRIILPIFTFTHLVMIFNFIWFFIGQPWVLAEITIYDFGPCSSIFPLFNLFIIIAEYTMGILFIYHHKRECLLFRSRLEKNGERVANQFFCDETTYDKEKIEECRTNI